MKTKSIILIILIAFSACNSRNKLNADQEKLTNQILIEDEEKEAGKKERQAKLSSASSSQTIRLDEDRSINRQYPPIVLDIPTARNKLKPVKYSEFGKSVRYIYLKHPNDSAFFKHGASIAFTKSNIIATTWRGIGRFDLRGQFIEMICTDGQKFEVNDGGMRWSTTELMDKYVGSRGAVSVIGDRIFYQYVDNPNKEAYLMEYDASPGNQLLSLPGNVEDNNMNGKGEIVASLSEGRKMGNITLLDEDHWFVSKRKFKSSKSGSFMTIHSLCGDTVCTLKDHDPVENFASSTYRGVESGDNYKLNGYRYFRQNFNDTIYRFESTNRLVPVYVIDMGEKGVQSSTEAITPKFNLADKFVYDETVETKNFLFFMYTQDYSCPNTARKGTLKYNRFVLNKKTGEQFHAYIDAEPYMPNKKMTWPRPPQKNIVNDLDFGPARWPENQTESGQIYFQISGANLKKYVQESKENSIPKNREKLETLAKKCSEDDVILMIIE